ncbi:uncharacterized protein LOC141702841 [Apium graveolens]|uniref:uncharacterized protein LOC141702841 n=1 Tax=Apium graveolens TaxID=4045 RepID=UPI003D79F59F
MDITFREADARWVHHPHNDALVISPQIGTKNVYRAFMDNGSSTNILYYNTYKKMGLPDRDMSVEDSWVYGFSGEGDVQVGDLSDDEAEGMIKQPIEEIRVHYYIEQADEYSTKLPSATLFLEDALRIEILEEEKLPNNNIIQGSFNGERLEGRADVLQNLEQVMYKVDTPHLEGAPLTPKTSKEVDAPVTQGASFRKIYEEVDAPPPEDTPSKQSNEDHNQLDLDPRIPLPMKKWGQLKIQLRSKSMRRIQPGESFYPERLANPVLVKKTNGKWRTCVDFTYLNKACPKDSFPLPKIDQLDYAIAGYAFLSFMDAYFGYNQIPMHEPDKEHTSFITDWGLYCYIGMLLGLINSGATYQRLVNKMFKRQKRKIMEVYIDDMLVKSKDDEDHVAHLAEMFHILRKYRMKLNPKKYVFGVESRKFLWFMINHREIEANPTKIKALLDIKSPTSVKQVQILTGRIATLN